MPVRDLVIEGTALVGEELAVKNVTLIIEQGIIHRIEERTQESRPGDLWICPALFNAHTHLGDSIAMDLPAHGTLDELVTPPEGLKHRILAETSQKDLIGGMRASLKTMLATGCAGFADFRESGVKGVQALRSAIGDSPCFPVIFGREGGELEAEGLGISSARDIKGVENLVRAAREAGRLVAFHAGERDAEDIDAALSYDPDLLVHCTHATAHQIARCADLGIPIAVCPRSNWRFGVANSPRHPPIKKMLEQGCKVLLGTDNCMFVQPDLWREISFSSNIYHIPPAILLKAAIQGSALFGRSFFIEVGNKANLLVMDPCGSNLWLSRDIRRTLADRAGESNIVKKVFNP